MHNYATPVLKLSIQNTCDTNSIDALENNTAVSLILLKSNVRGKSMKIYAHAMETKRYFKKIRKKLGHPYLYYTLGTVVACLS